MLRGAAELYNCKCANKYWEGHRKHACERGLVRANRFQSPEVDDYVQMRRHWRWRCFNFAGMSSMDRSYLPSSWYETHFSSRSSSWLRRMPRQMRSNLMALDHLPTVMHNTGKYAQCAQYARMVPPSCRSMFACVLLSGALTPPKTWHAALPSTGCATHEIGNTIYGKLEPTSGPRLQ